MPAISFAIDATNAEQGARSHSLRAHPSPAGEAEQQREHCAKAHYERGLGQVALTLQGNGAVALPHHYEVLADRVARDRRETFICQVNGVGIDLELTPGRGAAHVVALALDGVEIDVRVAVGVAVVRALPDDNEVAGGV